jgi:sensor histidine kinase YesM
MKSYDKKFINKRHSEFKTISKAKTTFYDCKFRGVELFYLFLILIFQLSGFAVLVSHKSFNIRSISVKAES